MGSHDYVETYDPKHIKFVSTNSVLELFSPGDADTWGKSFRQVTKIHSQDRYLFELQSSIQTLGMQNPIVLGRDGYIWNGHHRLFLATKTLDLYHIPVIFSDFVSYTQEKHTL